MTKAELCAFKNCPSCIPETGRSTPNLTPKPQIWVYTLKANGEFLLWAKVLSGIPQGSILFITYTNDLVETCSDKIKMYLFADDVKMQCHINNKLKKQYLKKIVQRTERWQVKLNIDKCKVISSYHWRYSDITKYVINNKELDELFGNGVVV